MKGNWLPRHRARIEIYAFYWNLLLYQDLSQDKINILVEMTGALNTATENHELQHLAIFTKYYDVEIPYDVELSVCERRTVEIFLQKNAEKIKEDYEKSVKQPYLNEKNQLEGPFYAALTQLAWSYVLAYHN